MASASILAAGKPHAKHEAIDRFQSDLGMFELVMLAAGTEFEIGKAPTQKTLDEIQDARAKMDADVAGAVRAAGPKSDLAKAIKECYAAADAYGSAGAPYSRIEKMRLDALAENLREKEKALDLELKLAGM
jgi:hypothetical protein